MTSKSEIESLIYLLEDPDPTVQIGVKKRFEELGEHAVPLLDQYRNESVCDSEKEMISDILYNITVGTLFEEFAELVDHGIDDRVQLEKAVIQLCRFGNPTLRTEEISRKLDRLAQPIGGVIAETPSLREKMQILLQYIFRELRFRGDAKDYHQPDNAYIDRVLEKRKGLPIMLSLIVVFIARRVHLPFYGVNMPIHFMLMYQTHNQDVLIDPFDGGTIVTYDQCCYFLKKNGIEPRPEHLEKSDEAEILARCIRNLIHSYAKIRQERKVKDLKEILQIVELKA